MDWAFDIYSGFNLVEGLVWIAFAIGIPFRVDTNTPTKRRAVALASTGFVFFAASDFSEAWIGGEIPVWLWLLKISSGLAILSSRFWYVGWRRFKFSDRYFLFGIACIFAVTIVIIFQRYAEQN
jgi:hypothetical protein